MEQEIAKKAAEQEAEQEAAKKKAAEQEAAKKKAAEEEAAKKKAAEEESAKKKRAEEEAMKKKTAQKKTQKPAEVSKSPDKQNDTDFPYLSKADLTALMQRTFNAQPQEQGDGRSWIVTGGEGRGGIIVRRGEGFDTEPFKFKLATGTTIEELEIVGNRLHYKRLVGDGPDWGWVNIIHNGKRLVQPL